VPFRKSKDWDSLYQTTKRFTLSPVVNLFRSVYSAESREETDREEIKRTLKRIESLETARLEKYLTFLATTGSTTPFIGLFGTVWGIMNSFRGIGRIGSATTTSAEPAGIVSPWRISPRNSLTT
jgi:biopolymer transport protein TolQ